MSVEPRPLSIRFDGFTIDTARRLLLRDGAAVPLNSKAFDLLVALVDGRGEVIAKDDLLARVWPSQVVEESNLTVHVSALRKVLGERRGEHRYIVTVPGRGYAFVGALADGAPATPPAGLPTATLSAVPTVRAPLGRGMVVAAIVCAMAAVLGVAYYVTTQATGDASAAAPRAGAAMMSRLLTAVGDVSSAIVASDGKRFAYVQYRDGMDTLWLGGVSGEQPVRLRGPEPVDYRALSFSPDGTLIFYSAEGALFQLPTAGGTPRRVVNDVADGFALSPDGRRVAFVRDHPDRKVSTIVVANLNDGAEHEVIARPSTQRISRYGPAWSPDGATLVTGMSDGERAGRMALTRVRIADGAIEQIGSRTWSDIGRLAWLRGDRGIVFNAVDADSDYHIWLFDQAAGSFRCITPDLSRYGRQSVSVSDDGESLVAVRSEIHSSIWVASAADLARSQPVTSRAFGKLDGSAGLAWTPDGRILYASFFNNSYSLWISSADGRDAKALTSSGFVDRFPQMTSDGRYIVFDSNRGGGNDVWRTEADGGHPRPLTFGGRSSQPRVSPDGRWVFFTSTADGAPSIWKVAIDGGTPLAVTHAPSMWPSVSPDGALLAYVESHGSTGEGDAIGVVSLETGRRVARLGVARSATFNNGLYWSPDGAAIVYRDFVGGLWRQPINGVRAEKIAGLPDRKIYFAGWSPDGRSFAMSYGDEVRDAVLMTGFR